MDMALLDQACANATGAKTLFKQYVLKWRVRALCG